MQSLRRLSRRGRGPVVDELHGHRVPDPYRWLEDADPRTRRWLDAQAELWHSHAAALPDPPVPPPGRGTDAGRCRPPVWRGDRQFCLRQLPGQEHPLVT